MPTLKSVRLTEGDSTALLRVDSDGALLSYRITAAAYAALGAPAPRAPLAPDTLEAIEAAAARYTARARALRMLAYSDNSEKALARKLRARGVTEEAAAAAVREMRERGYIREDEQAYRLVLSEANGKLRGPRRILAVLVAKGYAVGTVRAAIRRAEEEGEVDFEELAARVISRRLGDGAGEEEKKKLLWKQGF